MMTKERRNISTEPDLQFTIYIFLSFCHYKEQLWSKPIFLPEKAKILFTKLVLRSPPHKLIKALQRCELRALALVLSLEGSEGEIFIDDWGYFNILCTFIGKISPSLLLHFINKMIFTNHRKHKIFNKIYADLQKYLMFSRIIFSNKMSKPIKVELWSLILDMLHSGRKTFKIFWEENYSRLISHPDFLIHILHYLIIFSQHYWQLKFSWSWTITEHLWVSYL